MVADRARRSANAGETKRYEFLSGDLAGMKMPVEVILLHLICGNRIVRRSLELDEIEVE